MNTASKHSKLRTASQATAQTQAQANNYSHFNKNKQHTDYSISCKKILHLEGLVIDNGFILSNN
ncbi:hypothetical protein PsalN5692_00006 [Piscirickettsia salmonis]|uniref:hypothetical protein n=1 Tax=Piscirickettsia salmonis TaxID=1238 RepID=UPI0007C91DF1|nr:hypothetical protein A0O36_00187 [Piscirickettsiaceae bacterium NZ-RLO1]QGP48608.1 hypothetical protein PsalN5692_00006 [Piscirickettsia salmonis]QGP52623.1 hypothetical protein PsalSR1_00006 [Piscirickettsia salmonis]QGP57478.1 hypothetical protein PsalBI1_00008 [Piscirickettsia salmonis]QGP62191.1 hypothetical protein PsalMR5_00006 [Piscirickettsia salmonis]